MSLPNDPTLNASDHDLLIMLMAKTDSILQQLATITQQQNQDRSKITNVEAEVQRLTLERASSMPLFNQALDRLQDAEDRLDNAEKWQADVESQKKGIISATQVFRYIGVAATLLFTAGIGVFGGKIIWQPDENPAVHAPAPITHSPTITPTPSGL